jgi:HEPN domain-containing protein
MITLEKYSGIEIHIAVSKHRIIPRSGKGHFFIAGRGLIRPIGALCGHFRFALESATLSTQGDKLAGTLTIGRHIHECGAWLGPELVDLANEALSAYEEQKYLLAVTKAGSCLEGILKHLIREWKGTDPKEQTLGKLVGEARDTGRAEFELLSRLNEAVLIRNRAPHHQPHPLQSVTDGDALHLLNILDLVVCWKNGGASVRGETPAEGLPIFLSIGSPHRLDQEQFIHRLRAVFRLIGVNLVSLSSSEYSREQPFDQIRILMSKCRGALVVGLERSHAYVVFDREHAESKNPPHDRIVPTAWNQIEGSIASALALPVLVLRQSELHREGIFEASNHRHRIRDFNLAAECQGLSPELSEFLKGWVDAVRANEA